LRCIFCGKEGDKRICDDCRLKNTKVKLKIGFCQKCGVVSYKGSLNNVLQRIEKDIKKKVGEDVKVVELAPKVLVLDKPINLDVEWKENLCDKCKDKSAWVIVQLRGKGERCLNRLLKEVGEYEIEKNKYGIDIKLYSKSKTERFLKKLKREDSRWKIIKTRKLWTEKDGKRFYHFTYSVKWEGDS